MNDLLQFKPLSEINLDSPFFDSLREDYVGFNDWFLKKAEQNKPAYIFEAGGDLEGFLFLKSEINQPITDVTPNLPQRRWLKIGTFKINPHGTRLGERFMKKVLDNAFRYRIDSIYVTVFPKHIALIELFQKFGFEHQATKTTESGTENVLVKDLTATKGDILLDYPRFHVGKNDKFLLSIYPEYHTRLFPDSILNNESYDEASDVSHTNSVEKVYVCAMDCSLLKKGDLLLIYRTSDSQGPAHYRSVATSVCTIEEIRTKQDFEDSGDFLGYCERHSVFNRGELLEWYDKNRRLYTIKMVYNAAFKKRVTRGALISEMGLDGKTRWGILPLSNEQFKDIIKKGDVYESLVID